MLTKCTNTLQALLRGWWNYRLWTVSDKWNTRSPIIHSPNCFRQFYNTCPSFLLTGETTDMYNRTAGNNSTRMLSFIQSLFWRCVSG